MLVKPPEPKGKLDTVTVNGPEDVPDWDAIDWRLHEGSVRRLRRRIFKATRERDWATVRSLQKMMLRSWSNTLVSVRQVTQRKAGVIEDGAFTLTGEGTPQGGLCSAEHNPPYAQCRVMRSAGLADLVGAGSAGEHCA
jgi:hypothetical protein